MQSAAAAENRFIKDILVATNPKDGTHYWAGGVTNPHGLHRISGAPMIFTNFYKFNMFIHMNFYQGLCLGYKGHSGEYGNAAKLEGKMSKSVMQLVSIHF